LETLVTDGALGKKILEITVPADELSKERGKVLQGLHHFSNRPVQTHYAPEKIFFKFVFSFFVFSLIKIDLQKCLNGNEEYFSLKSFLYS